MAKFSTGLRNAVLASQSLRDAVSGSQLAIYAGTPPNSADDALGSAVLLAALTVDGLGTGVTFSSTASNGTIGKAAAENWQSTIQSTGTASFFRLIPLTGATDAASPTEFRIQGSIGVAGSDMVVPNTLLTTGETFAINSFVVALPTF